MRPLKAAHTEASASKMQQIGLILDHLVDALGGDPNCTLRRAVILTDIHANPGTTQAALMDRLNLNKSLINRDIEWLYDYGCILRQEGTDDGRVIHMQTVGYSKKNLDLALDFFGNSPKRLQEFLEAFINLYKDNKPTFRDAKILATMGELKQATRAEVLNRSYDGAQTTNVRALQGLVEDGLILKETNDG